MNRDRVRRRLVTTAAFALLSVVGVLGLTVGDRQAQAGLLSHIRCKDGCGRGDCGGIPGPLLEGDVGGTWYWLRSPDEEKRVVTGLYNRYCVRCHGVDGRGVWDIPDVPDFTSVKWQASRSDAQLVRITLEGRGAVMPPFRGTMTLEEAWAMARYLRTFVPGTEVSRPDLGTPAGTKAGIDAKPIKP